MKTFILSTCLALCFCSLGTNAGAQGLLKKLKEKVEKKVEKKADDILDKKTGVNTSGNDNSSNSTSGNSSGKNNPVNSKGRAVNRTGEGLKNSSVPDVLQQISEADQAYSAQQFGNARFSIQQALLGVELQMGHALLNGLPASVKDLPKDSTEDRVMSTRFGWSNLTIHRVYCKDDQQLTMTIGNSSAFAGMFDLYFGFAATQSNGEEVNTKQIRIKGNKAVIKYDENDGYTVLMQLGQSGMITWQGINFKDEQEITAAINEFNIDEIKKTIGEQ